MAGLLTGLCWAGRAEPDWAGQLCYLAGLTNCARWLGWLAELVELAELDGWAGGWPGWESARPDSTASQPSQAQPSKALPGVLPIVKKVK